MNVTNFSTFFLAFLFGACVLFIPIAIIGAFATKYGAVSYTHLTLPTSDLV